MDKSMTLLYLLEKIKTNFTASVALPSIFLIVLLSLFCGFFSEQAATMLGVFKGVIFDNLSWFYVLLVTVFVLFLLFVAISKFGKIKLGADDCEPEYSYFSWVSMLFAAGMGIGLMYFGVSETMAHYANPAIGDLDVHLRAKEAQLYTFFHWGIHAWAIYGVVGLSLAYFAYRYSLPLAIRSGFYPVLKDKINGRLGNIVDVFGLCSTFFGITTTLGFGVVQLCAGLHCLGVISDTSFGYQALIVVLVMGVAVVSALSGLGKGVKIMSEINIILATLLMLFVLIFGPTIYILSTFTEGLGHYVSHFASLTFNTYAYEKESQAWFSNWTILYWAWWISWAPYVGLFIAKISKGRSIREFIIAVLLIPSLFNFVWMTVFGSSAVWIDEFVAHGAISEFAKDPNTLLFNFFAYFPLSGFLNVLAIVIICVFFITSADSGIYIMNSIASRGVGVAPKWQNVFWGVLLIIVSLSLLRSGGLASLQTMTLVMALPFGIIMLLLCFSLWKALLADDQYSSVKYSHASNNWNDVHWKLRLRKILSYSKKKDIKTFLNQTVREAFEEMVLELQKNDIVATITEEKSPIHAIELVIEYEKLKNFKYGVKSQVLTVSTALRREDNAPDIDHETVFVPVTYFDDNRRGYDIQYLSKDEIIADVLRQYERFLNLGSGDTTDLLLKI
ncbi:choline/glycine/proline betaine transport protein [Flavobacterium succinicans]|uniref:Choline/glycine/proline betaine transport protein n=1 Tax=Flavobacterium succinicans TaxID=29536 RepID=A0A1I4RTZ8_9FLAO|nr:BCCT family transporter [Flavobacterium succinicans]SFM55493.1 choline/glycine/proline betaine transport protein [Flavobacterium succinicans]